MSESRRASHRGHRAFRTRRISWAYPRRGTPASASPRLAPVHWSAPTILGTSSFPSSRRRRASRASGPRSARTEHSCAGDRRRQTLRPSPPVGADRVVVVTSDRRVVRASAATTAVSTSSRTPAPGLNAAVRAGQSRTPRGGHGRAARRPAGTAPRQDLADALEVAAMRRAVVRAGRRRARHGAEVSATRASSHASGPHSAARHEADGAARLELDLPRLRTDVDDCDSLAAALVLGPGPAHHGPLGDRASGWIRAMQATVHTFDPETRTGSVLRDDGVLLPFDASAFDASGLRLLRAASDSRSRSSTTGLSSMRIVGIGPSTSASSDSRRGDVPPDTRRTTPGHPGRARR